MERQTGRSSRALVEAHKKYGKFVYVVNGLQSVRYYKELLAELNIPSDVVDFRSSYELNWGPIRGNSLPIVVDHNAESYLSYKASEYIESFNIMLNERRELEKHIRGFVK